MMRSKSAVGRTSEMGMRETTKTLNQQHKFKYSKYIFFAIILITFIDTVYDEQETNMDVYKNTVRKVAMASLEGINGTVFVYGQTGTGKTFTMMGHQRTTNEEKLHGAMVTPPQIIDGQMLSARTRTIYEIQENSGVLIYAMQDLFDKINKIETSSREMEEEVKFQIKLSYIEIYNEVVYDLLVIKKQDMNTQNLTIHESKNKEFHVNGANQIEVSSIEQVLELIKIGERNKHYAETFLNHCSSRSHTMFRLNVTHFKKQGSSYLQTRSFLNFVDLAGSEKISNYFGGPKQNHATEFNRQTRLKEGLNINQSLFTLTRVIHMLSQKTQQHIPYRNSVLTKLLRSSLGGNSRTSIIICITPANSQIEQTVNSLKFGEKAMKVQNSAKVQVNQMKMNALKNRHGLRGGGGIEERVLKEIVEEYETKIKNLERLVFDNKEIYKLKEQVKELQGERERLIHAMELQGDRTFFMRQLNSRQKKGFQVMSLQHAGDVSIQSSNMAILQVEQIMEDRDQSKMEFEFASRSSKQILGLISDELNTYKTENTDLKQECDKLENAYQDIIGQFAKMQQL